MGLTQVQPILILWVKRQPNILSFLSFLLCELDPTQLYKLDLSPTDTTWSLAQSSDLVMSFLEHELFHILCITQ
jgi:hypothetical protein